MPMERQAWTNSRSRSDMNSARVNRAIGVQVTMPTAMVRLSAGRREFSDAVQALCFLAGANSIFYGDKLLTTGNPDVEADQALLSELGMAPM